MSTLFRIVAFDYFAYSGCIFSRFLAQFAGKHAD
jgi:hypothetical protein